MSALLLVEDIMCSCLSVMCLLYADNVYNIYTVRGVHLYTGRLKVYGIYSLARFFRKYRLKSNEMSIVTVRRKFEKRRSNTTLSLDSSTLNGSAVVDAFRYRFSYFILSTTRTWFIALIVSPRFNLWLADRPDNSLKSRRTNPRLLVKHIFEDLW